MSLSTVERSSMMSSPSITTKGSSPTCLRATDTAWPRPERLALAHVVDVGQVGQAADLVELVVLARRLERHLELDRAVEVVLEAALAATGDDEDVVDAGPHGLLDDVLDRRLVDHRQHLLGLRLGGGQEAGAQPGGRDDGLAHSLVIGARLPVDQWMGTTVRARVDPRGPCARAVDRARRP